MAPLTAARTEMGSDQLSTMSLLECIQMRKWQKAIDVIAADRKVVYERKCHSNGRKIRSHLVNNNNNHDASRLPIHELCKITTSATSVRFSKDEISDDEEEGEDDDESNGDHAAEELDQIFDACELEEGTKMYEVTQFMIDVSHSLGPMRFASRSDDDENDNNNSDEIDVQQQDIERNSLGNDSDEERNNNDEGADAIEGNNGKSSVHESILTWADSLGKTPLHILCENSCDSNMMRVILGSTRDATGNPRAPTALSLILARDSRGSTPLHYLAYSRQCPFSSLKLMMEYCKPYAYCAHDICNDEDNDMKQSHEVTDPTLCTDNDGETPLHWALAGYVSSRRIKELTRHSLDAIMIKNEKGERPFDQFTSNFVDSDWTDHDICGNEVWENIQAYLRVIHDNEIINMRSRKHGGPKPKLSGIDDNYFEKSNEGEYDDLVDCNDSEWLPLHFLAGSVYIFPPIFMDLALRYCSNDLHKPDANGMLPLHLACERRSKDTSNLIVCKTNHSTSNTCNKKRKENVTDDSFAIKILKQYPRASLAQVPSTKRLALHLAVETKKPLPLIAALIRTYPRSLNIPDPMTRLWPYVLAGATHDGIETEDDESLSVAFALLRADPSVIHLVRKNEYSSNLTHKEKSRQTTVSSYGGNESRNTEESYMEHSSRRIRRPTIRDY